MADSSSLNLRVRVRSYLPAIFQRSWWEFFAIVIRSIGCYNDRSGDISGSRILPGREKNFRVLLDRLRGEPSFPGQSFPERGSFAIWMKQIFSCVSPGGTFRLCSGTCKFNIWVVQITLVAFVLKETKFQSYGMWILEFSGLVLMFKLKVNEYELYIQCFQCLLQWLMFTEENSMEGLLESLMCLKVFSIIHSCVNY